AVVVAGSGEDSAGHVAFTVPTSAFELRPVQGLDPDLGLVEVTGAFGPDQAAPRQGADWERAVALGQLALAHELVGAARAMLELARQHALGRIQFGRPIASFQAVRHRLAESLVAVESAAGLLAAAWEDPAPATAAMAKGFAGRSARTVARHAQQVLAGIGFTTEHPLHTYVRRTLVLDQLLGAGAVLTRELGAEVLRTGSLPAAIPL
ncbi:MAG TPA: acyl-CoA dehydrogenase family protein, partial [Acidimicrobiales bacterium]|nr:acyl-CoA dehydrogenase family protein [Acidimicrobiales bacterium]